MEKNILAEHLNEQVDVQLKQVENQLKQNVAEYNVIQEDINRLEKAAELIEQQKKRKKNVENSRKEILHTKLILLKKKYPHVYCVSSEKITGSLIKKEYCAPLCLTYARAKERQKELQNNKYTRDSSYKIEIYELSDADVHKMENIE